MRKIIIAVLAMLMFVQAKATLQKSGGFNELLSYVPSDTAYFFGNKEALPKKLLDTQFQKIDSFVEIIAKTSDENDTEFLKQYTNFAKAFKEDNLSAYGIKKDMHLVVYGYKFMPVVRIEIQDTQKLITSIEAIAKENNKSIEWKQCGNYRCISEAQENDNIGFSFVIHNRHIALSIYDLKDKNEVLTHLTGEKIVNKGYSIAQLNSFLQESNFLGYGDGFVHIDKLTQWLVEKIKEKASKEEQQEIEQCSKVALDITRNLQKISLGFNALDTNGFQASLIYHTEANVTQRLKKLTKPSKLNEQSSDALLALGINLNATGLVSAIGELTNFVATSAQEHNCTQIKPAQLRQSVGMITLSVGMFLEQIDEIYIALNELELSKEMQPTKLSAVAKIASNQPTQLISQLAMLSPQLANIKFPPNGDLVDLKPHLPSLPPFIPSLKASIKDNVISIYLGEQPKMQKFAPKANTILWMQIDEQRYYALFSKLIKEGTQTKGIQGAQADDVNTFIDTFYRSNSIVKQSITVDDRGFVFITNKSKK
jgi:hypothetical protein